MKYTPKQLRKAERAALNEQIKILEEFGFGSEAIEEWEKEVVEEQKAFKRVISAALGAA